MKKGKHRNHAKKAPTDSQAATGTPQEPTITPTTQSNGRGWLVIGVLALLAAGLLASLLFKLISIKLTLGLFVGGGILLFVLNWWRRRDSAAASADEDEDLPHETDTPRNRMAGFWAGLESFRQNAKAFFASTGFMFGRIPLALVTCGGILVYGLATRHPFFAGSSLPLFIPLAVGWSGIGRKIVSGLWLTFVGLTWLMFYIAARQGKF